LTSIATYAQGVGPNKVKFTDVSETIAKERVAMAKNLNLSINPYTFR
jgi:glycerophosphoryl diester phosphodiesterase